MQTNMNTFQADIVQREHSHRQQSWEELIDLLDRADAIQQQLLGDEHSAECYEFHNTLQNLVSEFELWAAQEEAEWQAE